MPDLIARLKQKITEIDVPVQSVLLEAMFVELDETGARNVGLNLNNASSQIGTATFETGAFIPSGFPTTHGLSSANFQAAIYAQVQAGRGRIVSKPRIAAQSGSTAKIITGDALQTSATVHDGETFVIGGLTQENKSLNSSKVPILGDIPLLSALFDLHQDTSSKTDLYIVVTPHVIRRGEPLPPEVGAEMK